MLNGLVYISYTSGLSRLFLQQLLRHYRIIAGSVSAESDLDERFTLRPGLVVFLVLYL